MQDNALSVTVAFPAASATAYVSAIDLGVVAPGTNFLASNAWRLGRIRVKVPTLANHTDVTANGPITFTLQDALVTGVGVGTGATSTVGAYANTNPLVQYSLAGVATTGSLAKTFDIPIPPTIRGPFRIAIATGSAAGDNTASALTVDWTWE